MEKKQPTPEQIKETGSTKGSETKNPMVLMQQVADFVVAGRPDLARALTYELLNTLNETVDRVEVYPMSAPHPDVVRAIQNLVSACYGAQIPNMLININVPSAKSVILTSPNVHVAMIPEFTEAGYENLKVELRKAYDAWNKQALEVLATMGDDDSATDILLRLHQHQPIDFTQVKEEMEIKTIFGWFTMAVRFAESMSKEEQVYLTTVNDFLGEALRGIKPVDGS